MVFQLVLQEEDKRASTFTEVSQEIEITLHPAPSNLIRNLFYGFS